ncbi:magnesium transporter [Lederbergia lenta]|uniref:Magnesium transporter MgtE n=1 Tax=Lederbergia lenta TaxID=1467 RepID=A0A2X4WCF0_LEDLE|nr:magnesium transporter [Lederbergia lenta]MCM3110440.1 magnesium transporter [Lederbergia lenta]MEC2323994.1 magnesium transporter [Lederbergia lenta]SQI60861.1 magnesium transporter [Lederbergia lenta]
MEYKLDDNENLDDEILLECMAENKLQAFRKEFMKLHPYDQAQFFSKLELENRIKIYHYLSPTELATFFEVLDIDDAEYEEILAAMEPKYAADTLANMYTDNAVDVLNTLGKDQAASYLTIMEKESAHEIKGLLHYEESTAGSIMTTDFVAISQNQTVRSAMYILKYEAQKAETIYYVYVLDDESRLVGVLSLRDLIINSDDTMISEIMYNRIISISVGADQEDAARQMRDYDLLALPVVDFQNHLLGIITFDDIIDVIDEEASDDYSKLAGVSDMDTMDKSPFTAAKKRLPWLIILLFLGMFTASLIGRFEDTLSKVSILAVFIPLIAGMAGNSGTQSLAVAVRGLATGELQEMSKMKLIMREAGTGLITGSICGVLVSVVVYVWKGELFLGFLVGISILASLFVATLAGSLVPLLMEKLKIDPAVASGPFITTMNDITSILIYFGLATMFMSYLVH